MNFFQRRRLKKAVHHMLHVAAHARHMRGDIASPEELRRLIEAEDALRAAWKTRDTAACDKAADTLNAAIEKVYPTTKDASWRENVEIFAVALAVAMAFRTYFLQPFKIPTNSMWPTLYGITVDPTAKHDALDTFPLSLIRLALFGERYIEVTAQASGVPTILGSTDDTTMVEIGGIQHKFPRDERCWVFNPRQHPYPRLEAGQIVAAGRRRLGDHLFVNRVAYNLHRPTRGDIFVFSTIDMTYPGVQTNDHYIKRLVGLPGETIHLLPPHLIVNKQRITNEPFARLLTAHDEYAGIGYTLPNPGAYDAALAQPNQPLQLSKTQYLPFGDNTDHSLDGRYFGGVEQKRVVGPACFVYWPFGKRWGLIQ